jgi:sarcosine oxidase subunit gamma
VSLAFLSPDPVGGPPAAIPGERHLSEQGARFAVRDGWRVPVDFGDPEAEERAGREGVVLGDRSDLGVLEVQAEAQELAAVAAEAGGALPALGTAARREGAWWCPLDPGRLIAIVPPAITVALRTALEAATARSEGLSTVVDLTAGTVGLAVVGPGARELLSRLTAIDLRPERTPVGGFRPGSVARVPGMVLREGPERYLVLAGASHGEHLWRAASDAGAPLGAVHAGALALERLGHARA